MQLFYFKDITPETTQFAFDKEESKHIIRVLRKSEGDILHVTNGEGSLFETKIVSGSDKKCAVEVINHRFFEQNAFKIHLAVAPTKMNDRFEWFLEKATEIGIDQITPILCDRSERKNINTERFEKIILSAMKQCNQTYLPKLNPLTPFKTFVENNQDGQLMIAHCDEDQKKSLKTFLQPNQSYTLLIGPEGDFSEKEILFAKNNHYQAVTLGETRLRTETAAVVACHSMVFFNQL